MALYANGNEIKKIIVNDVEMQKVYVNGNLVFDASWIDIEDPDPSQDKWSGQWFFQNGSLKCLIKNSFNFALNLEYSYNGSNNWISLGVTIPEKKSATVNIPITSGGKFSLRYSINKFDIITSPTILHIKSSAGVGQKIKEIEIKTPFQFYSNSRCSSSINVLPNTGYKFVRWETDANAGLCTIEQPQFMKTAVSIYDESQSLTTVTITPVIELDTTIIQGKPAAPEFVSASIVGSKLYYKISNPNSRTLTLMYSPNNSGNWEPVKIGLGANASHDHGIDLSSGGTKTGYFRLFDTAGLEQGNGQEEDHYSDIITATTPHIVNFYWKSVNYGIEVVDPETQTLFDPSNVIIDKPFQFCNDNSPNGIRAIVNPGYHFEAWSTDSQDVAIYGIKLQNASVSITNPNTTQTAIGLVAATTREKLSLYVSQPTISGSIINYTIKNQSEFTAILEVLRKGSDWQTLSSEFGKQNPVTFSETLTSGGAFEVYFRLVDTEGVRTTVTVNATSPYIMKLSCDATFSKGIDWASIDTHYQFANTPIKIEAEEKDGYNFLQWGVSPAGFVSFENITAKSTYFSITANCSDVITVYPLTNRDYAPVAPAVISNTLVGSNLTFKVKNLNSYANNLEYSSNDGMDWDTNNAISIAAGATGNYAVPVTKGGVISGYFRLNNTVDGKISDAVSAKSNYIVAINAVTEAGIASASASPQYLLSTNTTDTITLSAVEDSAYNFSYWALNGPATFVGSNKSIITTIELSGGTGTVTATAVAVPKNCGNLPCTSSVQEIECRNCSSQLSVCFPPCSSNVQAPCDCTSQTNVLCNPPCGSSVQAPCTTCTSQTNICNPPCGSSVQAPCTTCTSQTNICNPPCGSSVQAPCTTCTSQTNVLCNPPCGSSVQAPCTTCTSQTNICNPPCGSSVQAPCDCTSATKIIICFPPCGANVQSPCDCTSATNVIYCNPPCGSSVQAPCSTCTSQTNVIYCNPPCGSSVQVPCNCTSLANVCFPPCSSNVQSPCDCTSATNVIYCNPPCSSSTQAPCTTCTSQTNVIYCNPPCGSSVQAPCSTCTSQTNVTCNPACSSSSLLVNCLPKCTTASSLGSCDCTSGASTVLTGTRMIFNIEQDDEEEYV